MVLPARDADICFIFLEKNSIFPSYQYLTVLMEKKS